MQSGLKLIRGDALRCAPVLRRRISAGQIESSRRRVGDRVRLNGDCRRTVAARDRRRLDRKRPDRVDRGASSPGRRTSTVLFHRRRSRGRRFFPFRFPNAPANGLQIECSPRLSKPQPVADPWGGGATGAIAVRKKAKKYF